MLSGALMVMFFGYIYFNFKEFTGIQYNWFLAFLQIFCHFIGHILTFMPMLWLGYSGMPRRIQDYPWGYASWHSLASFGHLIVLFSIIFFFFNIFLSLYLKRVIDSRNKGLPFIFSKLSYLCLNKYYISSLLKSKESLGVIWVKKQIALKRSRRNIVC
jgi:heme/copper-type cytochrome/quinol oxidase subunit 1